MSHLAELAVDSIRDLPEVHDARAVDLLPSLFETVVGSPSRDVHLFSWGCGDMSGDNTNEAPTMTSSPRFLRLGACRYDIATRRLTSPDGDLLHLRAQSAQILHVLAQNVGHMVPKDQLIDEVWQNIAVTDGSLSQCIRDVRLALNDRERSVLETVPKQGFMLNGTSAGPAGRVRAASVAARTLTAEHSSKSTDPLSPQLDPRDVMPTLAVLPFQSIVPQEFGAFGFFLADEIARLLGLSEDVNVISRMSTGTLGGPAATIEDARNRLSADFVLSGFLAQTGEQVAVSLEFAETETGYVLWADRLRLPFDAALPETQELDLIVSHIKRAIMTNEVRRVHSRPMEDLKLFSILQGAVGLMHRLSLKDFTRSKGYLEHLHNLMPHHPAPLAWMARWHALNAVQGWAQNPKLEAETALQNTARALDMDPNHTLALVCEGQVLVHLSRDLTAAEQRYNQALENNPNDANGRSLRGMLKAFSDRGDEGKRDTERALHLTPLDPHRFMYLALAAGTCLAVEDYARAVKLASESLRLNRSHLSTLRMLAVAQLGAGEGDAARKTTAELLTQQPDFRVSDWLRSAPSADFNVGLRFADMLKQLGIPE